MTSTTRKRPLTWIVITLTIWLTAAPVAGQTDEAEDPAEIQAVFRLSKAFLAEVTDRPMVADIPLCARVLGFRCDGMIHGEGKLDLSLQRSGQQAVFEVTSQGSGHAQVRGIRGPIVAHGTAWGPFSSRTLVQFDGRNFYHAETIPHVTVCADVQRVTGRHDRRLGRLIGAGMLPLTDKLLPSAIAEATPIANRYLKDFVEETADKIILKLNQKTPIEESVNRLFPKTSDWVFQMSGDEQFLQAAFGPPEANVPTLPQVSDGMQDVRLEAWLRSTREEAKLLQELSGSPLTKQLVQRYLESQLPELAALAKERSVSAIGPWVVIRIGAPES